MIYISFASSNENHAVHRHWPQQGAWISKPTGLRVCTQRRHQFFLAAQVMQPARPKSTPGLVISFLHKYEFRNTGAGIFWSFVNIHWLNILPFFVFPNIFYQAAAFAPTRIFFTSCLYIQKRTSIHFAFNKLGAAVFARHFSRKDVDYVCGHKFACGEFSGDKIKALHSNEQIASAPQPRRPAII